MKSRIMKSQRYKNAYIREKKNCNEGKTIMLIARLIYIYSKTY